MPDSTFGGIKFRLIFFFIFQQVRGVKTARKNLSRARYANWVLNVKKLWKTGNSFGKKR